MRRWALSAAWCMVGVVLLSMYDVPPWAQVAAGLAFGLGRIALETR